MNVAPGSAGLGTRVFFIWGSTCFCCIVFTYFCIPEVRSAFSLSLFSFAYYGSQTKGLSLEQIDVMYQNTTPIRSLEYRRRLIAQGQGQDEGEEKGKEGSEAEEEPVPVEKAQA